MLLAHAKSLLRQIKHVVTVATSDLKGEPNAAVKMLIDIKGNSIYLVDYSMGTTWENLKVNPKISLAFEDVETSKGYRINGTVEIIDSGVEYDKLLDRVKKTETAIVVNRVIEGIQRNKKFKEHLIVTSDKFVIYKVRIKKIVEFGPHGALRTEEIETIE
jgi:pyridoxine/pyridoxamine 5'-phosphate oxidase